MEDDDDDDENVQMKNEVGEYKQDEDDLWCK